MEISFYNSNDKEYQVKLNKLLSKVFLDFKFWYDLDLWDENYESYSISDDGEIVSNICVYKTHVIFDGKEQLALSIGAVATKIEYRGRGFSRKIMENIIKKYHGVPMYLSANEDVIEFYTKLGFERAYEKLPTIDIEVDNNPAIKKLKFDDDKVKEYVYNRINYSNQMDCLNTASINMFHIHLGYLKEDIYELEELKTMIVAYKSDETLKIKAIYSLEKISFSDLLKSLPFSGIKKIEFGFMPTYENLNLSMVEDDADPWFIRNISCDISNIKFPELSTT